MSAKSWVPLGSVAALLFASGLLLHASPVDDALASLCDPAKLATLGERGTNPRVRKIAYWLERARQQGESPEDVMARIMQRIGWGEERGAITAAAMVRNRLLAEKLGCLDPEDLLLLRRGLSPMVETGPYAGTALSVDHIIPRAVVPELDNVLANLELMAQGENVRKGDAVGRRQIELADRLVEVGLLSQTGRERLIPQLVP